MPGYVDHPLAGIEVGPGELHVRTFALWIDTTLVIDRVSIRATVVDAVSGVPLDRLASKLRPGVGATAGDHVVIRMGQWSPIMLSAWSLPAGYYTIEVDRAEYEPMWWTVALPFGTEFHSFAAQLMPSSFDLLDVSVQAVPTTIGIGEPLPFDVTITNLWTSAIDGLTLRIEVNGDVEMQGTPAGCTYQQGTASGVFTCAVPHPIGGDSSVTISPVVRAVSIDQGSSIIIVAEITGWDGPADPTISNNSASTFVLIDLDDIDLPVVTTIEVTPASSETVVGGSVDFAATAFDQNGAVMPAVSVAWSSTHACVATVDASGSATAVGAPGTAQIRATSGDVSGSATLVVAGGTGSAPVSVAGRWIVCEISTGDHLLTLDLWHETGQAAVTGQVTMASGALSSASGRWENEVLAISWDLLVQGGARTFSIVGATPSDEHALRGDYNDRYKLSTYPVDLDRVPIP